ncbi:MAG: ATP-binding protein [Euryarchaeota archaeon]
MFVPPESDDDIPGEEPEKNAIKLYGGFHKASYSFEQVIADLIDNSIDAEASFVEVLIQTQNLDTVRKEHKYLDGDDNLYCIVLDDGNGIPEDNMHAILSRGFDRDYDETELGSYGVGLKDASLSQAYELTVFSKCHGNSEISIRRLSSCLVRRYEAERIFSVEHLDDWMTNTPAYQEAFGLLDEMEKGTVVLLEGMHKLELKIGDGDRQPYMNAIHSRVKNYIRLIFQYYLEGVEVPRLDGSTMYKKIDVYYGDREEENQLLPLDPFYREPEYRNGTRTGTTSISAEFETTVEGDETPRKMRVTAWLLPHRGMFSGVARRETQLGLTKEGKMKDDGTVGGVGVVDLQGAYIYRNMRLIQFAPDRDPWLGIMTKYSHHNQMRLEVHLPPGRLIGGDSSDFDINTSKSDVGIDYSLLEQLRDWANNPGEKFHPEDPVVLGLQDRVVKRNGRDNWPACGHCGSEEHTIARCPTRPRCPICNRVTHTEVRECPDRPPCEVCGTRDHITEDHPEEQEGSSEGDEDEETTPVSPPEPVASIEVRPSTDGDLISSVREGDGLIVRVNVQDPLYPKLREAINDLDE